MDFQRFFPDVHMHAPEVRAAGRGLEALALLHPQSIDLRVQRVQLQKGGREAEGSSEREGQGEEEMEVPEWLYLRGYISPFKCKGRRGTERGKDC